MSDSSKDPAIKLFGKTIQLPDNPATETVDSCRDDVPAPSSDTPGDDSSAQNRSCSANDPAEDGGGEDEQLQKNQYGGKLDDSKEDEGSQSLIAEELTDKTVNEMETDELKTQSSNKDCGTLKKSEMEEASNSQEKALKKPDKILPCPRCNSMETKFCYFNNYNVNQPRHFCRNCQRYWTAGGTMRNVPVGAGRRKNKNSGSHYRHVTISEPFPSPRVDLPIPTINPNGTLLTFGSDTPLCESMASGLNIAEKKSLNRFQKLDELGVPVSRGDNGDDHSNGSLTTGASTKDESVKNEVPDMLRHNCPNFAPQLPCFPGAPWPPYPLTAVQWSPPGFPMPIYPAPPYWGCAIPGPWSVPWVSPPIAPHHHMLSTSGPNSPTLGKHSRDENTLKPVNLEEDPKKESNPEKCLWVPKTLRIDDPEDAAKSSIWATLGIKNDKADLVGGGLFKAFQTKDDEKTDASENSTVLQANPAALSRSLNFHENT